MVRFAWLGFAIVVSALMLVASMPPARFHALGWFYLVPVWLALRGHRWSVALLSGIALGLVAASISNEGWLYSHRVPSESAGWLLLLFCLFGLVNGVVFVLIARGMPVWQVACGAIVCEGLTLIEIPVHVALSQYQSGAMLGIASVGGIWLVSGLVWLMNGLIADAITARRWPVLGLLALVVAGFSIPVGPGTQGTLRVALCQFAEPTDENLTSSLDRAVAEGAQVALLPELAGSGLVSGTDLSGLTALSAEYNTTLVTSASWGGASPPRNRLFVLRRGTVLATYDKQKLFASEKSVHSPGTRSAVSREGPTVAGLLICFDTCYPSIVRASVAQPDVNVLYVPTLDPASPHGVVSALHAAYQPFRAAESGVPIVRTDAFGWSMAVDEWGRIIAVLGAGDAQTTADIRPTRKPRIAQIVGDGVLWLACLASLAGAIHGVRVRHAYSQRRSQSRG